MFPSQIKKAATLVLQQLTENSRNGLSLLCNSYDIKSLAKNTPKFFQKAHSSRIPTMENIFLLNSWTIRDESIA